jgi:hypothetical protein
MELAQTGSLLDGITSGINPLKNEVLKGLFLLAYIKLTVGYFIVCKFDFLIKNDTTKICKYF